MHILATVFPTKRGFDADNTGERARSDDEGSVKFEFSIDYFERKMRESAFHKDALANHHYCPVSEISPQKEN